jgi:hypothetical protein
MVESHAVLLEIEDLQNAVLQLYQLGWLERTLENRVLDTLAIVEARGV